jgi:hypothetical protein
MVNADKHANAMTLRCSGHGELLTMARRAGADDTGLHGAVVNGGTGSWRNPRIAPRYHRTTIALISQVILVHFTYIYCI